MLSEATPSAGWGWAAPDAWPWLVVAIGCLGFAAWFRARGVAADRRWLGPRHAALTRELTPLRGVGRTAASASGAIAVAVALLQPTAGRGATTDVRRPIDLVIGLDVSRSMLAQDVAPSRLAAARSAIRGLAERMGSDAVSLVAFAGATRTLIPLSRDGEAVRQLVDLADPSTIGTGGTDLGEVLRAGLDILRRAATRRERKGGRGRRNQAILLVTDGEDLGGRGLEAARACAADDVRVYCLGIGSSAGSKIALPDSPDAPFVVDRAGREVVSAVDAAGLERIATAGSGRSVHVYGRGATRDPAAAMLALYENEFEPLGRAAPAAGDDGAQPIPRFQIPLLIAGVGWLLAIGFGARRALPAVGSRTPEAAS